MEEIVLLLLTILAIPMVIVGVIFFRLSGLHQRIDAQSQRITQLEKALQTMEQSAATSADVVKSTSKPLSQHCSSADAYVDELVISAQIPDKASFVVVPEVTVPRENTFTPESSPALQEAPPQVEQILESSVTKGGTENDVVLEQKEIHPASLTTSPEREEPVSSFIMPEWINKAWKWLIDGNLTVKIGVLFLLIGIGALLRFLADIGLFNAPIEVRLAGVTLMSLVGLYLGWAQRERRPTFALTLQGGALGSLLLVVFAGFKIFNLLPAGFAFVLTLTILFGAVVMSITQNALILAALTFVAGFLAPIWLSSGSNNYVGLFSYYAILNLAILLILKYRPWAVLSALGFLSTSLVASVWWEMSYQPEFYLNIQLFAFAYIAYFLFVPYFLSKHQGILTQNVQSESVLEKATFFSILLVLLGAPVFFLSWEYMLLHSVNALGYPNLIMAAVMLAIAFAYVLMATRMMVNKALYRWQLILTVGLSGGLATLALPLVFSLSVTALLLLVQASVLVVLLYHVKLLDRVAQKLLCYAIAILYCLGVLLLLGAVEGYLHIDFFDLYSLSFSSGAYYLGLGLLCAILAVYFYRCDASRDRPDLMSVTSVLNIYALCGAVLLMRFLILLINWAVYYPSLAIRFMVLSIFLLMMAAGLLWLVRYLQKAIDSLRYLAKGLVTFGMFSALYVLLVLAHESMFNSLAMISIYGAVFLVVACYLIRLLNTTHPITLGLNTLLQNTWLVILLVTLAYLAELGLRDVFMLTTDSVDLLHHILTNAGSYYAYQDWLLIYLNLPFFLVLAVLYSPRLKNLLGLITITSKYQKLWLGVIAFGCLLGFVSLIGVDGHNEPLPWIPLLNPLEVTHYLLGLVVLTALFECATLVYKPIASFDRLRIVGLYLFLMLNLSLIRALWHWYLQDSDWSFVVLASDLIQMSLSIFWSLCGVAFWVYGVKRVDRLVWGLGALLMGLVLLKLLFVDRTYLGNLTGIISFLMYGLMCTGLGYYVAPSQIKQTKNSDSSPSFSE